MGAANQAQWAPRTPCTPPPSAPAGTGSWDVPHGGSPARPCLRAGVGIHLHHVGVDLRVDDHPGAPAQLAARRQVDKGGLAVGAQRVHNEGAGLQGEWGDGVVQRVWEGCCGGSRLA